MRSNVAFRRMETECRHPTTPIRAKPTISDAGCKDITTAEAEERGPEQKLPTPALEDLQQHVCVPARVASLSMAVGLGKGMPI